MRDEEVVLVDNNNKILGTMPKFKVHKKKTPLHRAFSVFIFNNEKKILLQKRSKKKKTWPNAWSNSCCGHPKLNETNFKAARRRIKEELGINVKRMKKISPYRYKFSKNGIMENEICPVLFCFIKEGEKIKINKLEIESVKWVKWREFIREVNKSPKKYSPWCVEQAKILAESGKFNNLLNYYENKN